MRSNSPPCVPADASIATPAMPVYSKLELAGQVPAGITDVLTIGAEATVFRPVQRAVRATGWAVAHSGTIETAATWLRSNVAAVAVAESDLPASDWRSVVSTLRTRADGPEVVRITRDELPLNEALNAGAFDALRRPFDHADLLWAVATAWHHWMTRRERGRGGGRCPAA